MTNRKNAVEELIAEGMASIEESFRMAKATQPDGEQPKGEGDLDGDFKDFNQSREASDAAEQDEDEDKDGEGEGDKPGAEAEGDSAGGDPDEDADGDSEDAKPGEKMAKAEGGFVEVDATALLASIDASLSGIGDRIAALESSNAELARSNATLAKAVQASAHGSVTMAKAMQTAMGQPLASKTRAVVPVKLQEPADQAGGQDRKTVMAKALQACENNRLSIEDVATLEVLANQYGVDKALSQLPQVAEVIHQMGGGK